MAADPPTLTAPADAASLAAVYRILSSPDTVKGEIAALQQAVTALDVARDKLDAKQKDVVDGRIELDRRAKALEIREAALTDTAGEIAQKDAEAQAKLDSIAAANDALAVREDEVKKAETIAANNAAAMNQRAAELGRRETQVEERGVELAKREAAAKLTLGIYTEKLEALKKLAG